MTSESRPTRLSLLSRVRDPANDEAWREFDETYRELIVRYCRARGLQLADAEDIRQTVMLQLSKSLRTFQYQPELGRFRHYLGRAVRNAIIEHTGRPKKRPQPVDTDVLAANAADEAEGSDALWEREWIDHHYRLAMQTIRTTFDARSVEVFDRLLDG
ncbi:MAG: sigma-70 family RNA polymerase sigma factor, partial [Phycisphaerae bacterium]